MKREFNLLRNSLITLSWFILFVETFILTVIIYVSDSQSSPFYNNNPLTVRTIFIGLVIGALLIRETYITISLTYCLTRYSDIELVSNINYISGIATASLIGIFLTPWLVKFTWYHREECGIPEYNNKFY